MTETIEHGFGRLVGGRLCLDFVNTVGGRVENPATRSGGDGAYLVVGERLVSYEALLGWSVLADLMDDEGARSLAREAVRRPADSASVLDRSIAVREATYRLFKSVIEESSPEAEDVAALDREVLIARSHERLVGSPRFAWEWDAAPGAMDRMLWPVVLSAAALLTAPEVERVGQCPGDRCGWLFLDTSRSRRRRWCDMADCGNVAKVRRFRERRLEGAPPEG